MKWTDTTIHKYPCYTTKSGLRIGSMYVPPQRNVMSREDEFWQARLLGPGRSVMPLPMTREQIDEVVGALCAIGTALTIFYYWLT